MKKIVPTLLALALFVAAPQAHASGLTDAQIQSVLGVLSSFGVDQTTVNNVDAALHGRPQPGSGVFNNATVPPAQAQQQQNQQDEASADVTFSAAPSSGFAPLSVTFSTNAAGTVTFDDGTSGNISIDSCTNSIQPHCPGSVAHTYQSSGTYTASFAADSAPTVAHLATISVASQTATAPTVTLTQSVDTTTSDGATGSHFTVTWSSTNATSCTVQKTAPDGALSVITQSATSGAFDASPYKIGSHHWWIDCTGPGGTAHADLTHTVTMATQAGGGGGSGSFTATPTSGDAPLSVTFTLQNLDQGVYIINFGDNSTEYAPGTCITGASVNCSNGGSVVHVYQDPGTYTATLVGGASTCSGSWGGCSTGLQTAGSVTVTVGPAQHTIGNTQTQNLDAAGLMAAIAAAPFNLMVDSLTDWFVVLGIGQ